MLPGLLSEAVSVAGLGASWAGFGFVAGVSLPNFFLSIVHLININNFEITTYCEMNQEERIEEHLEVQKYLEKKKVYQILQGLVEELLVQQPSDPLAHMISALQKPETMLNLLIGPPGLHLYKIASSAISQSQKKQYSAFNSGEYVASLKDSLSKDAQDLFKDSRLIPDSMIGDKILNEVVKFGKEHPYSIIEGFPKTLDQGISLHRKGCIPNKVIFVNVDEMSLYEYCASKVRQNCEGLSGKAIQQKAKLAAEEYKMNIKDLKAFYPTYLEIDAANRNSNVSEEIKKCLSLHFGRIQPRKNTKIVIVGSPLSGRTTLGKKIAAKYSLIYISTAVLISEEIRKETVVGRKISEKYLKNELIDNFTIEKLIEERISKLDCQMQGYVLEGYPKNKEQLENMNNLHIYPDFIIGVNCPEEVIRRRIVHKSESQSIQQRIAKWVELSNELCNVAGIFWVNPSLSIENTFETVCFEIENRKN